MQVSNVSALAGRGSKPAHNYPNNWSLDETIGHLEADTFPKGQGDRATFEFNTALARHLSWQTKKTTMGWEIRPPRTSVWSVSTPPAHQSIDTALLSVPEQHAVGFAIRASTDCAGHTIKICIRKQRSADCCTEMTIVSQYQLLAPDYEKAIAQVPRAITTALLKYKANREKKNGPS